jgi:hypothetical protein
MRFVLVSSPVLVAGCVHGESDAKAARDVPPGTYIDHRVHLSGKDRNQIVRLVAQRTSQHIDHVWWDGPDKLLVCCGYNDVVAGKHPMRGDAFILQRTSSGWKITEQPNWVDQFAT